MLRVLNDDIVDPGMGFGTHPHDNMEIISIPLEGDLEHKDSMGNTAVIKEGDIQVMSAGTGVFHSEYNKNADKPVKFLQIWVFPDQRDVKPRYDQISLERNKLNNQFYNIISPKDKGGAMWIHQNAWFHLGDFEKGEELHYELKGKNNGVYLFLIDGELAIENQVINRRDGYGMWDTSSFSGKANSQSRILIMEVPMEL